MTDIGAAIWALKLAMAKAGASGEATVTLHLEDLHLVKMTLQADAGPLMIEPPSSGSDEFEYAGIKFKPEPRSTLNPLRRIA